jgi:hypothetical protein
MMNSINEQLLIEAYEIAQARYETESAKLEQHFLGLAQAARKEGRTDVIEDLLRRCPASVTRVFLLDVLSITKVEAQGGCPVCMSQPCKRNEACVQSENAARRVYRKRAARVVLNLTGLADVSVGNEEACSD